ncbi:MAG: AarF/ABC1/UbiB kinase family protein [Pseudomonadota bacterium]
MEKNKPLKKLKQNGLQRRIAVSLAGVEGGARLLTSHVTSAFYQEDKKAQARKNALAREATAFSQKLGELKGAYVKIGQMMALYGDHVLPREVTDALRQLENQTSPMHWEAVEPQIKAALGKRFDQLAISEEAMAAASLSQVHRAKLNRTGEELCLKVQYPGIANTIESDFNAVLQMVKLARWVPAGSDFANWMEEIKAMLVDEVDYQRELRMTDHIATKLQHDQRFLVPKTKPRISSRTVLAMQYLEGEVVTHESIQNLSQRRRNDLAKSMLELFFKEVFEWGVMQTDPNFGNYRIQLKTSSEQPDKLVLLDFGAVRKLDPAFMQALQKTIVAAYRNDRQRVIEGATDLHCLQANQSQTVKESFADFCILLMEPFRKDKTQIPEYALNNRRQYKWRESQLLKRVAKLGAKSIALEGFQSPPREFALIARKLTGVFTFVTALGAELNAYKIIDQYSNTGPSET